MGKVIKTDKFNYKKADKFVKETIDKAEKAGVPFIFVVYEQEDGLHYQYRLVAQENVQHFSLGALIGLIEYLKHDIMKFWDTIDEDDE